MYWSSSLAIQAQVLKHYMEPSIHWLCPKRCQFMTRHGHEAWSHEAEAKLKLSYFKIHEAKAFAGLESRSRSKAEAKPKQIRSEAEAFKDFSEALPKPYKIFYSLY